MQDKGFSNLHLQFVCLFSVVFSGLLIGYALAFPMLSQAQTRLHFESGLNFQNVTGISKDVLFSAPDITVQKYVTPTTNVPLGGIITYTIALSNNGDDIASNVIMTDDLPSGVSFEEWVQQGSASLLLPPANNPIVWGPYDISADQPITIRFTAKVSTNVAYYGSVVTNSAEFVSANAGSGFDKAAFSVENAYIYLPLVMRNFPPIPVAKYMSINEKAEYTYQITTTLTLSATVIGDTVEEMRFSNDGIHWSTWQPFTRTTDWTLAPDNGLKVVYVRFKGGLGGISQAISDDILLFRNGDFSQGLTNWNRSGELPVSLEGGTVLLGDSSSGCHYDKAGHVNLEQSFIVPDDVPAGNDLVLRFTYHMYSYDRNIGLTDQYDRFDVLFDSEVVFKDANDGDFDGCNLLNDLEEQDGKIVVTGNPGEQIRVEFRVYNRPDRLYKTYVYLDDVHLEFVQQDISNTER